MLFLVAAVFSCAAWFVILGQMNLHWLSRFGASILLMQVTFMSVYASCMMITNESVRQIANFCNLGIMIFSLIGMKLANREHKTPRMTEIGQWMRAESSHLASVFIPSLSVFIFSSWVVLNNGDQGWDSNAYHLPIAGLLLSEGSSNFAHELGSGTFTILTPYASHILAAILANYVDTYIFSSLITWLSIIGYISLSYGVILRFSTNPKIPFLLYLYPLVVWSIPSVIGQTTHFYVDALAGIFVAAMFIFSMPIILQNEVRQLSWFLSGSMGAAAIATKSQSLYPVVIIGLATLCFSRRETFVRKLLYFIIPFIFLGAIPYLRNLLDFGNPFYPIKVLSFPGSIGLAELSQSVEHFAPHYWTNFLPIRLIFSLIVGAIVVSGAVILSRLGSYDPNRNDLAGFNYDTAYGGAGLAVSLVLLLAIILFFVQLFKRVKNYISPIGPSLNYQRRLMCLPLIPIVTCLFLPGAWWVRYNLGQVLIFLFLSVILIEKCKFTKVMKLLISAAFSGVFFFQFLLLASYSIQYEYYAAHRKSIEFNRDFGLSQNLIIGDRECDRLIFIEPRPTFTSPYYSLKCSSYEWTSNPKDFIFKRGDYVVMSRVTFNEKKELLPTSFSLQFVRAWFDPNGDYEAVFLKILSS